MPGMIIEPEGAHSPRVAGGMAVDAPSGRPHAQPDNVGILAAEVYFPNTYVCRGCGGGMWADLSARWALVPGFRLPPRRLGDRPRLLRCAGAAGGPGEARRRPQWQVHHRPGPGMVRFL